MTDSSPTLWQKILIGDYYRLRKDSTDGDLKKNQIVVVAAIHEREQDGDEEGDGRSIEVRDGSDDTWTYSEDEFASDMERLSDGPGTLQAQIDLTVQGMADLEQTSGEIRVTLSNASPHLDLPVGEISEKTLMPAVRDLAQTRQKMASARNKIAKLNLEMKKRQAGAKQLLTLQKQRMQAMFEAQSALLAGKLGDLNKLLAAAEEAIWTINLYLGKDETIVQVAKGKPAPKDTRISIRQLVLYADEECAIGAEDGGIDFKNLKAFDEWVAVPAHRRQVLPEAKGVVAFKVRRNSKKREDVPAWIGAEMDKQDKKTYFLMANGENLYRICTELEVGDHIIPVENEHSDLFFTSDYDYDARAYKKEPIYPGDARYMAAMEKATELKKHYLCILLFLQGLLDRTAVFAPLPAPRLNLLNRAVYNNDHLAFINDAEKLLTSGRPPFSEWLKSINSKLDVGHRIMGTFSSYESGLRNYRRERSGGNERLSPSNAEYPDDLKLYTIQKHAGRGSWFFLYDRDETIYRRRRSRFWSQKERQNGPAQRRASCEIESSDTFILNFDLADVASMEWYLGNRTDRHSYTQMFPLLKAAIQIKHDEAKQEAPFRDLLAREILKAHQVTLVEAQAATEDLVSWWKLKNKEHRALLADDAKALRMIVKEFGIRQVRAAERSGLWESSSVVSGVLAAFPSAVCIAHKKEKTFVALVPEVNPGEPGLDDNVYVCEQSWVLKDKTPELVSEAHWCLVERKRLMSWKVLHQGVRWDGWKINAREAEHLTRPERDELLKTAKVEIAAKVGASTSSAWLVCITHDRDPLLSAQESVFRFWLWSSGARVPQFFLSGEWKEPEIQRGSTYWSKKKGLAIFSSHDWHSFSSYSVIDRGLPWAGPVIEQDESVIAALNKEIEKYSAARQVRNDLNQIASSIVDQAQEAMTAAILEKKKAEFLREYEHEELWEDHKKSYAHHELTPPHPVRIRAAVSYLIERKYHATKQVPTLDSFDGLTYGELLKQARDLGWKPKNDDDDRDHVPVKIKFKFEKPQEEEEGGSP